MYIYIYIYIYIQNTYADITSATQKDLGILGPPPGWAVFWTARSGEWRIPIYREWLRGPTMGKDEVKVHEKSMTSGKPTTHFSQEWFQYLRLAKVMARWRGWHSRWPPHSEFGVWSCLREKNFRSHTFSCYVVIHLWSPQLHLKQFQVGSGIVNLESLIQTVDSRKTGRLQTPATCTNEAHENSISFLDIFGLVENSAGPPGQVGFWLSGLLFVVDLSTHFSGGFLK